MDPKVPLVLEDPLVPKGPVGPKGLLGPKGHRDPKGTLIKWTLIMGTIGELAVSS